MMFSSNGIDIGLCVTGTPYLSKLTGQVTMYGIDAPTCRGSAPRQLAQSTLQN
ncbi:MAG: hypothetical protein JWL61_5410 [Gemmatimonadetes bacterium]|jgi:hypothetical protein|nr:hypothetical protein [Gemmatimonadota bacterium]